LASLPVSKDSSWSPTVTETVAGLCKVVVIVPPLFVEGGGLSQRC
jgi:hypothetical protein